MIAAHQIAFGKSAGAKGLSAKDYIQDGLVAMWDGIENAGWGVHDPSATVWKDLVGGMDVVSDTPLADGVRHWESDAFVFDAIQGEGLVGVPNNELKDAIENCVLTVDSAFYTNGTGSNNTCLLQVSNGALVDGLLFATVNSTVIESGISDGWVVSRVRVVLGRDWGFNNKKIYASYKCNGNVGELLVNCDGMTSNTNTLSPPVSQGQLANSLYLGSYSWTSGRKRVFMGGIHSVRIYNRALTAEEIAHNYEIDKARFGL
jgi:hypothetical protein